MQPDQNQTKGSGAPEAPQIALNDAIKASINSLFIVDHILTWRNDLPDLFRKSLTDASNNLELAIHNMSIVNAFRPYTCHPDYNALSDCQSAAQEAR